MPKILVTGASGLLGRQVFAAFASSDHEVKGTFHSRSTDNAALVKLDLCDEAAVDSLVDEFQPDVVVHCAGVSHCADVKAKDKAIEVNGRGTAIVCAAANRVQAWTLVISCNQVFDGVNPPFLPHSEPCPATLTGESKVEAEKAAREANASILRVPTLYGPVAALGESRVTALVRLVFPPRKAPVEVDNVKQMYPTHTADVAAVILQLAECGLKDRTLKGIWHASAQEALTRFEAAKQIAEILGVPHQLVASNDPSLASEPRDPLLASAKGAESLKSTFLAHSLRPVRFQEFECGIDATLTKVKGAAYAWLTKNGMPVPRKEACQSS